jgi:uncharacterized membrane protein YkgB
MGITLTRVGLVIVLVCIGSLKDFAYEDEGIAAPRVATVGSFLVFGISFVTLSFLITTPEAWVPALGSSEHGFPLLSGASRLVVKDAIMMGAALVTMVDSAKAHLRRRYVAPRAAVSERELAVMAY